MSTDIEAKRTIIREHYRKIGSLGGKKRVANMTKEEIVEICRKAGKAGAAARWGKKVQDIVEAAEK